MNPQDLPLTFRTLNFKPSPNLALSQFFFRVKPSMFCSPLTQTISCSSTLSSSKVRISTLGVLSVIFTLLPARPHPL